MNEIITTGRNAIVPQPRVDFSVRVATPSDIPFMDSMQKKFGKQLGYFPTKQFEGYVEMGGVLLAESNVDGRTSNVDGASAQQSTINNRQSPTPVGYVISRDRYLKRDELGVIYQLCVAPGTQRKLVGASLIAEVFRRSAYGCKLYCCWCAQDIDANYFWESIGFVPIAFRAGGKQKANPSTGLRAGRVHIFWQRRVHADDVTTPWWYPCATNGGAIREDRLVFPIPPGVRWQDVSAVALSPSPLPFHPPRVRGDLRGGERGKKSESRTPKKTKPVLPVNEIRSGGLRVASAPVAVAPVEKKKREPRAKVKVDPALVAKARELRDRWMEQLNLDPGLLLGEGKYDVARLMDKGPGVARSVTDRNVGATKALLAPAA